MKTIPLTLGFATCLLVAPTQAAQFKFPNQTLTVPDGFEVELVAGPPLMDRPITADFDEQGRLYVTESSGTNDKADKQLQDKPHRIVRLEDTDGDGRFDKHTVFAGRMMFPEGCLWHNGSLYVSAPPSIWKLTDTDGDGVADVREEWFQGKTLTGCANDLHGPCLGLDGWIYWCKGAFAKQTYERSGRPPLVTKAAHIFRSRPDGTEIEPVLTGGMDNPVCVAFTPGGERILTGTFFVHPGGGQRDGLIHAIYGGVYGKDHDVLDGHKRTGDLMPIMTHHGPSASCYVTRYESSAFGEEYRDNLFACLFNLHKVMRHVLLPDGATFKTRDEDFVQSDNPDFHPTALLEDADGSLLVVDTGGWYKLCCPTSQLWKPDVLGAIYRIRRTGAATPQDPRGLKIQWSSAEPGALASLLDDPRPFVRNRAIQRLGQLGGKAAPALRDSLAKAASSEARRNAVWALTRIEGEEARAGVRDGMRDREESVRQASAHSASLWRDRGAMPELKFLLSDGTPALKRVAAEALGRIGDAGAVPALFEALTDQLDRVLEHSLVYALIEINHPQSVRDALAHLQSESSGRTAVVQAYAFIALDQIEGGSLKPDEVGPLLASRDARVKKTASWIVGHHPEWAGALAASLRERLLGSKIAPDERADLERLLGDFAQDGTVQELLAELARNPESTVETRQSALRAMAAARLKDLPKSWAETLVGLLSSSDPGLVSAAVTTAHALPAPKRESAALSTALRKVGRDGRVPEEVRLEAVAAATSSATAVEADTFEFLRSNLDPAKPVLIRGTAAQVLSKAALAPEQLSVLTDDLKKAGPLELPKLLGAFAQSTNQELGLRLVQVLRQSTALTSLRAEMLLPRLTNFPTQVQEEADALLSQLNVDAGKQKIHLDELLEATKGGDVRRGQIVFNSQKAACATCHAIGYLGGKVGPDLTRIGQVRTERDLLEAIVYPSASFVRSYEPLVVTTRSGDDYNGVLRKDAPDEILLATGPGAEVRLARSDIAEMRPGNLSVMPGGMEEQLSRAELADLLAFLKATRW